MYMDHKTFERTKFSENILKGVVHATEAVAYPDALGELLEEVGKKPFISKELFVFLERGMRKNQVY